MSIILLKEGVIIFITPKRIWKYPLAIEKQYEKWFLQYVKRLKEIEKEFMPDISRLVNLYSVKSDSYRNDGLTESMKDIIAKIKNKFYGEYSQSKLMMDVSNYYRKTDQYNDAEFIAVMKSVSVDVFKYEPELKTLMDSWVANNVRLIQNVADKDLDDIANVVNDAVQQGSSGNDAIKQIQDITDVTARRAKLIAVDQIGKLNGTLTKYRQTSIGITHFKWRTAGDQRVRPDHVDRNGQVYSWDHVFSDGFPGIPIRCVKGESKINLSHGCHKLWRRWYNGNMVKLTLSDGGVLETTPNHPILTQRGWIPINDIEQGDNVVKCFVESSFIDDIDADKFNVVMSAKDIFNAFELSSKLTRTSGSVLDFHGDGTKKDVNVISVDRFLSNNFMIRLLECFYQFRFAFSYYPSIFTLFNKRRVSDSRFAHGRTSDSFMSFFGKTLSFLWSGVRHSDEHTFCSSSLDNVVISQNTSYNNSFYTKLFSKLLLAITRTIKRDNFILWKICNFIVWRKFVSNDLVAPFSHSLAESVRTATEQNSKLGKCFAFNHELVSVVNKSVSKFSGHVYNLQTDSGYYIADDYIISNCRCVAIPQIDLEKIKLVSTT